ncbi:type III secretion system ATPase SctN [Microbulbifer variabilis]|uniref:type III secretion system ATPase SctN n=1 Tax=Microbulbifer variabilis TaxID=266805 RepID=UPI001CFC7563|nr:type III secretion system ATPase SctN [Microbulbifer variabilis]
MTDLDSKYKTTYDIQEKLKLYLSDTEKKWIDKTHKLHRAIAECKNMRMQGWVNNVSGTIIKAQISDVKIGELCRLVSPDANKPLLAEVVGLDKSIALLSPLGDIKGISSKTEVIPTGRSHEIEVGNFLLGSVLDGLGNPIRKGERYDSDHSDRSRVTVTADAPDAMARQLISRPVSLGIKAIDSILTCGEGQRVGVFAAAGGGKSTLLSMIIRNADVDVIVIALIGERGREVREFIDHDLGSGGLTKAVLVVATSDRPAMERAKAALVATAIAEFFREQGKRVLLLMDSVTRYARSLREIGLAAGEPPTRRGYPPSVFAALPQLMERAGNSARGSITACYTVLVEGDDMTEPVADETRSILDGHIILSRALAAAAHFPAVDILLSASRVMNNFVTPEHKFAAMKLRNLLAKYKDVELLVRIGEYQRGNDRMTDEAVDRIEEINDFLRQGTHESIPFDASVNQLLKMFP